MRYGLLATGVIAMLASGCASVMTDSTQNVHIDSRPDAARVTITDQSGRRVSQGETPMTATLDKAAGYFDAQRYEVTLAKQGFADKTVVLQAYPNGWYLAGNLVFGQLIGWLVVDPLTGSMFTLSPREVSADLRARTATTSGDGLQLRVVLLREIPPEARAKLERLEP